MPSCCRIFPSSFSDKPLGTGQSDSRFTTKNGAFTILYAAADFATAFVETVVRDRFLRKRPQREIRLQEVRKRAYAHIASDRAGYLNLLDLRGDGPVRLGAPTDTVNARNHAAGRAFARAIYAKHKNVDGIIFPSRLSRGDVSAVFDRAIEAKLVAQPAERLLHHPELAGVLERFDIKLIEEEAPGRDD